MPLQFRLRATLTPLSFQVKEVVSDTAILSPASCPHIHSLHNAKEESAIRSSAPKKDTIQKYSSH
jgi:hypothetical protein